MTNKLILIFLLSVPNYLFSQTIDISELNLLLSKNQFQTIIDKSILISENNIDQAEYYYILGISYRSMDEEKKALEFFQKANNLDENNIDILFALGKIYYDLSYYLKAKSTFEEVLEQDSLHLNSYIALGKIYLKKYDYVSATNTFEKLHKLRPDNSTFTRQIAFTYYKREIFELAKEWYWFSYNQDSISHSLLDQMSTMYFRLNENDTCQVLLENGIHFFPENPRFYRMLGNVYFARNHHFRALPNYQKAFQLGDSSAFVCRNLGFSNMSIKEYDSADVYLTKSLMLEDIESNTYRYLGINYRYMQEYEKSIEYLEKAMEMIQPNPFMVVHIYDEQAETYLDQKKYYKVLEVYKKLNNIFLANKSYKYLIEIADLYATKLNNKKKAIEYYQMYIKLNNTRTDENFKLHIKTIENRIQRLKEDLHFSGEL